MNKYSLLKKLMFHSNKDSNWNLQPLNILPPTDFHVTEQGELAKMVNYTKKEKLKKKKS